MRWVFRRLRQDDGMATAEYAVVMLAAVGFGLLLYKLLTGPNAAAALGRIIQAALSAAL
jgi:hypothetical protein